MKRKPLSSKSSAKKAGTPTSYLKLSAKQKADRANRARARDAAVLASFHDAARAAEHVPA